MDKPVKEYRAAVIGAGYMGRRHIDGYMRTRVAEVVGAAARSESTTGKIRRDYGIETFTDYKRMIEETKPDLISICAPTLFHLGMARYTLGLGMHTIVEKPMTETPDEAEELCRLAEGASAKLMVAHTDLYDSGILKLMTAIQRGYIGEVERCHYIKAGRDVSPGDEQKGIVNAEEGREESFERVYNLLIHMSYIVNKIAGAAPAEARTEQLTSGRYHEKVDSTIRYENGVEALLKIDGDRPGGLQKEIRAEGTKGAISWKLKSGQATLFMEGGDGGKRAAAAEPSSPFDNTIKYFVEFVSRDIHPYSDAVDGKHAMQTARMAIENYNG